VFTRTGNTWTQQQKLFASDGEEYDHFGYSVSIFGDTAFISGGGGMYVFTRTGTIWTQQQKLMVDAGGFGCSVSLDGDTALIGACADNGNTGSAYVFIKEAENQPPNNPTITGPAEGKIKVATDYNFTATDPDSDEVYYFIDWGDDTNSSWIGPYSSGDQITKSHTWSKKGPYTIKAKAKDIYGSESDWGTLDVTMPKGTTYFPSLFLELIERFMERFPHAFPILRQLLGY
jgi:hypothetical protein